MSEGQFLNYNGKIVPAGQPVIHAGNRSFRYGDGCFETMRLIKGELILGDDHFQRLFNALDILKFKPQKHFTKSFLLEAIGETVRKNKHTETARVRMNIFRGDGGLYDETDHQPNFIIETWELDRTKKELNSNGLLAGIFPGARKAADQFSHIKSNNYQPYLQAALWAKEKKLNEAFILNSNDRLADATIANIFIVNNGIIQTPALTEGCVAGVMRKYILRYCKEKGLPAEEKEISIEHMKQASEIFLTNAITGIRWVKECEGISYRKQVSAILYNDAIVPLFKS
ncbi:MAG: hypothetical protein JWN76_868 [Chitinophagaceae bacterium]|nr:hypothetical protein [Chitinophagaceae bacterium]